VAPGRRARPNTGRATEGAGTSLKVLGPIYGYRAWRLRGSGLYSFSGWRPWPNDEPKAALCWKNFTPWGNHCAPGYWCHCGIHAWIDIPPKKAYSPQGMTPVWGIVELSGRAIEHDWGYRAQYARPVAIVYSAGVEGAVSHYELKVIEALEDWQRWV
jgi:hypothetical protein